MTRRARKHPKRRRGECFLMLHFWELDSPAFKALTADAVSCYLELRKRLSFDGSNNGHVLFALREAQAVLHSGWRRAANALAELAHFGFIKCRENGMAGAGVRPASQWQLTAFECGGQQPSKDFMRHGKATDSNRRDEKQSATGNMKAPRRQHEGADSHFDRRIDPEMVQSAGNMKALRADGRRQHEGTIITTREGGPELGRQKDTESINGPSGDGRSMDQDLRPQRRLVSYGGKRTLRQRAGEFIHKVDAPVTRKAIMAEFGIGPGPAQRVLTQLCAEGFARKLDYGRYGPGKPMPPPPPRPSSADNGYAKRGARIRAARLAIGLSGTDLAAIAKVLPQVVSAAERGRLNGSGGPVCGRPAYSKLEAALGLDDGAHHEGT